MGNEPARSASLGLTECARRSHDVHRSATLGRGKTVGASKRKRGRQIVRSAWSQPITLFVLLPSLATLVRRRSPGVLPNSARRAHTTEASEERELRCCLYELLCAVRTSSSSEGWVVREEAGGEGDGVMPKAEEGGREEKVGGQVEGRARPREREACESAGPRAGGLQQWLQINKPCTCVSQRRPASIVRRTKTGQGCCVRGQQIVRWFSRNLADARNTYG